MKNSNFLFQVVLSILIFAFAPKAQALVFDVSAIELSDGRHVVILEEYHTHRTLEFFKSLDLSLEEIARAAKREGHSFSELLRSLPVAGSTKLVLEAKLSPRVAGRRAVLSSYEESVPISEGLSSKNKNPDLLAPLDFFFFAETMFWNEGCVGIGQNIDLDGFDIRTPMDEILLNHVDKTLSETTALELLAFLKENGTQWVERVNKETQLLLQVLKKLYPAYPFEAIESRFKEVAIDLSRYDWSMSPPLFMSQIESIKKHIYRFSNFKLDFKLLATVLKPSHPLTIVHGGSNHGKALLKMIDELGICRKKIGKRILSSEIMDATQLVKDVSRNELGKLIGTALGELSRTNSHGHY